MIAKAKTKTKPEKQEKTAAKAAKKFFEGIGRRKTAIARVRLYLGAEDRFIINGKDFKQYFPTLFLQRSVKSCLEAAKPEVSLAIDVKVRGGGKVAQADAVRMGISRAFSKSNPELAKRLRKLGYLTRDSRMRERKKFGLKRARRAPQWRKR